MFLAFALVLARLLLVIILVAAGLAKLVDLAGSRRAVADFGLPAVLVGPLGLLLPLAELATAALLIPAVSAWWGALAALMLLLAFTAAIGINLAQGRKPDCHCFGQLHSEPVSWRTLARNVLFIALAGFVVWQGADNPGPSAVAWLGDLTPWQAFGVFAGTVAAVVIAAQSWFLLQLFRQHGRLLLRLDALERMLGGNLPALDEEVVGQGLPIGMPAPAFELPDLDGARVALDDLRRAELLVLLVFVDPGCDPCTALVPSLARWQEQHREALTLVLVSRGTPEENRAKVAGHDGLQVLLQTDREVAEAYQAHGTPAAVVVRPDGTIGSPVAMGAEAITRLFERTAATAKSGGEEPAQAAAQLGSPAPAFSLPDLTGREVTLKAFRGQPVLMLFWHPGCGYCARMLPDLKRWEAAAPEGAPKLLLVSGGTVEANRAMELQALVVLDQGFTVGQAFGAGGTPSAVLVDAEGRIASAVAVGAAQVFKLLEVEPSAVAA
jgi:peroxiredoxin